MKLILAAIAVAAAGAAGTAWALQDDRAPVNKTCPVMKGKAVKTAYMSVHEGRPIGFCCGKCKKLWDQDPSEYAGNLPPAEPPKVPEFAQMGKPAPVFELKDTDGSVVKLADFKDQVVVLQWTDPECPVSKRVAEASLVAATIKKIGPVAAGKMFHFSVCSAKGAKAEALSKFLGKSESKGLLDADGKIAKLYGTKTTPQAFVIDGDGVLRYAGAIDNDPDGKKGDKAVNYVAAAITAILEGKKVSPDVTKPYGTPLNKK
jgi:peroxiredoxin